MFNLIGNTCCASWITQRILHQEFINPLCWSIMDFTSAYNCIAHFYDVNWLNIQLNVDTAFSEFSITVDKCFTIIYVHYKFSPFVDTLYKKDDDVYFNKIWEYIVDKYIDRARKMCNHKIPPRFIFTTPKEYRDARTYYSLDEQYKLAELATDYPIIFSFPKNIKHQNVISVEQNKVFSGNSLIFSRYVYNSIPGKWWE